MIKPTIGRIMWYWGEATGRGAQPYAGIVTYVHSDNMVNLTVFDWNGNPAPRTSVPIVQDGSPYTVGDSQYCEWMPYQIGQAKRHEAEDAAKGT